MDLLLYARVLWRFRLIVLAGFLIAVVLAALSVVRVSATGVTYRQAELWSSTTRLGVTQSGFPWGRLFAEQPLQPGQATPSVAQTASKLGIPIADPNRLTTLAVLYAELTTSDPVKQLIVHNRLIPGKILATSVTVGDNRIMLPLIDVTAIAASPRGAANLASRAATALQTYIREQQRVNKVPETDRVILDQVLRPSDPRVFRPRSKTMPAVVFLAVMLATVGIAFFLENVRPRSGAAEAQAGEAPPAAPQWRTA